MRPRFAFSLSPYGGELLSSYLVRSALLHGSTPYRFYNLLWPGRPVWNRDTDRISDQAWLGELALASGADASMLAGATLRDFALRLSGSIGGTGDIPFILSLGVFHRTRRLHGLQYCPQCLNEDIPYAWFRKQWRVGFIVACQRHGNRLLDACPNCDAPIVPHRSSLLLSVKCHNCGASLAVESIPQDRTAECVLRLQDELTMLLESQGGRLATSRARFRDLRTLLGVAVVPRVFTSLARAFNINASIEPRPLRVTFEHARITHRIALLENIANWTACWPDSFRDGAKEAGLTRRAFARSREISRALRSEIARLPEGERRRRRRYAPLEGLTGLWRRDRRAYRQARAERLIAAISGRE